MTDAEAHVIAQERLRAIVVAAVAAAWAALPRYDRDQVEPWLATVVPLVLAGQRQSVALTEAFIARALRRQPLGVNPANLIGAAVRNGTAPQEVYQRPFVNVWTALKDGKEFEQAVAEGLDRATSAAATDVQLSMRATAAAVGGADPGIYGWQRVTDGNACDLCLIASTQRYHKADLLPIHNHCGCSVAPITEPSGQVIDRALYRRLKAEGAIDKITAQRQRRREREAAEPPAEAEVVHHGELGPVLVDPAHTFTLL